MSGQANEDSSLHLSLEAQQSVEAHNDRAAKKVVLGLAGLMLMGVAVFGVYQHDAHAGSASQTLGFSPGFQPARMKTQGFQSRTPPVYARGDSGQGIDESQSVLASPTRDEEASAFEAYEPQAIHSEAVSLAKRLPGAVGSPMSLLAVSALVSGGNPNELASVFTVMPEEEVEKVEVLKVDVLAKAKSMPGVTGPLGFFDPMGFCTDCSEGKLCFYREVELKHGRVGMLASLGFLVGEQFHPLFGGNIDVPSYLAFQQTPLQTFWPAVVAAIAIPELFSVFTFNEPFYDDDGKKLDDPNDSPLWTLKTNRLPGDFNFDPLGLKPTDPKEFLDMQNKELNNGRLAMIAAAGMIAQELATGQKLF